MTNSMLDGAHHKDDKAHGRVGFGKSDSIGRSDAKFTRSNTKSERILRLLLDGYVLDFQSVRPHGDSCLHSTVSTLRHTYAVAIDDEPHVVRGFNSIPTHCKRYRLNRSSDNLARVRRLLGVADDQDSP